MPIHPFPHTQIVESIIVCILHNFAQFSSQRSERFSQIFHVRCFTKSSHAYSTNPPQRYFQTTAWLLFINARWCHKRKIHSSTKHKGRKGQFLYTPKHLGFAIPPTGQEKSPTKSVVIKNYTTPVFKKIITFHFIAPLLETKMSNHHQIIIGHCGEKTCSA